MTSGEAPTLLQVRALSKSFGGVVANDAVSFDEPQGAIAGLIGPNGSGKTTLFNCAPPELKREVTRSYAAERCLAPSLGTRSALTVRW